MKLGCWLLFLLISLPLQALPQVSAGKLQRLEKFPSTRIPARTVDIWLPDGFSAAQKYAVLYMHDGQMLFDGTTSWNKQEWRVDEVAQQLQNAGKVRPFIVVAVHNHPANRHAEYFPQAPFLSLPPEKQQALYQLERQPGQKLFQQQVYSDRYLQFLVTELKPYIDSNFSVYPDPANTFVMGSSMGGLISMYALSQYPQVFGGAACLSTHWPGTFSAEDNPIPATFLSYMRQHLPAAAQHKIYFDYGDQTLDAMYPPLQQKVDQLMRQLKYPETLWQTRFFPGTDHSEAAWSQRLHIPLEFLLAPEAVTP
ncbi:MAG: alpha/beta hydrolase [Rheinheimera sp.]